MSSTVPWHTVLKRICFTLIFVTAGCVTVYAQDETENEIWPEINVFVPLNEKFRLMFLASVTKSRETQNTTEGTLGAHLDYFWNRRLTLRAGYRRISALNSDDPYIEHRMITEQTLRFPLKEQILLTDRNRQDFRWMRGDFSFRYRNRLTVEKEYHLFGRPLTPYGSAEVYFDSRFSTFNRYRFVGGIQISKKPAQPWLHILRKERVWDIYYLRQEDTRSEPKHVNALGITFSIHF